MPRPERTSDKRYLDSQDGFVSIEWI